MKKSLLSIAFIFTILLGACTTESENLESPNKEISIQLELDSLGKKPNVLFYQVDFKGKNVVVPSPIHFTIDDSWGAENLKILNQSVKSVNQTWQRTWGKNKDVVDHYNEYTVDAINSKTNKNLQFIFRLYDDGIAFRYCIPGGATVDSFNLTREISGFNFADNHSCWGVDFSRYYSAQEKEFEIRKLDHIKDTSILGIPLVVEVNKQAYVAIAEANLTDWAGMFLKKGEEANTLRTSLFPRRDLDNVLVRTEGKRYSPWRVLMIGDNLGDLVETDIISNLNEPCAIENTDWIKPGKSAWDWWWSNSYAPDANFELGPNTETMKYFIDLAAEMGWKYQLVDWQWYGEPFTKMPKVNPDADITTPNPNIDIPELVEYGKKKNVGILVWLHWESAKIQMDEAFPLYEKWGVKGVKVDFMNREDQQMVNFYHKLVKKAAEHQLLVDFHGAYKPTGWSRTYPNLVTREGILGNEYNKWSTRISLEHTVLIPFTRGLLGELDFTPGGYYNVHDEDFKIERKSICPNVRGTRCHQLAMNVVYESVLQIMCGAPYNYRTYPQGNDFLSIVPTTWDETKFVDGYPGDLVCIARRSGSDWFIGGMTDEQARSISFNLDFLDDGKYKAELWSDDPVATEEDPKNLKKSSLEVVKNQSINIDMIRGGGFVMHLTKL
ncbi:MAG: glycoside hydrolase family 97 protein [Bacteroidales bacterium]|nr:glycoside hydrolase family 97 protein [Bacteroidales bacterium]